MRVVVIALKRVGVQIESVTAYFITGVCAEGRASLAVPTVLQVALRVASVGANLVAVVTLEEAKVSSVAAFLSAVRVSLVRVALEPLLEQAVLRAPKTS